MGWLGDVLVYSIVFAGWPSFFFMEGVGVGGIFYMVELCRMVKG